MSRKLAPNLAVVAIVLLAAMDVALLLQNRKLKQDLALRQRHLKSGATVPPLRGIDLEGKLEELTFGSDPRETLMLVFSPQCGWCQRNMPNWKALVGGIEKRKYRVVAVSSRRDGAAEYARTHRWTEFPVFVEPDPRDAAAYHLEATPQTLLIDSRGVVRRVWLGAFDPDQEKEIEQAFGVELPGLPESGQAVAGST